MKGWFSFEGRGDRIDFVSSAWLLIPALCLFAAPAFVTGMGMGGGGQRAFLLAFDVLVLVMGVVCLAVAAAGAARRLHDLDVTAWALVVAVAIPIVGVVGLFVLAFLPGAERPNRYGRSPHPFSQASVQA